MDEARKRAVESMNRAVELLELAARDLSLASSMAEDVTQNNRHFAVMRPDNRSVNGLAEFAREAIDHRQKIGELASRVASEPTGNRGAP
jgi:hypothetical protein